MSRTIWLEEHADLEKYGNELLYKVNIRNQQSRAGIQYSRVSLDARLDLTQLNCQHSLASSITA